MTALRIEATGATPVPRAFHLWRAFARAKVEIAVMEVGVGGRLDATNLCAGLTVSLPMVRMRTRWFGTERTVRPIGASTVRRSPRRPVTWRTLIELSTGRSA